MDAHNWSMHCGRHRLKDTEDTHPSGKFLCLLAASLVVLRDYANGYHEEQHSLAKREPAARQLYAESVLMDVFGAKRNYHRSGRASCCFVDRSDGVVAYGNIQALARPEEDKTVQWPLDNE